MKRFLFLLLAFPALVHAASENLVVRCVIGKGSEEVPMAAVVALKRTTTVEVVKEVRFPKEWALPIETKPAEGEKVVTPVTPLSFDTMKSGWVVKFSADRVGELIRLSGEATFAEPEFTRGVYGEQSGPVYSTGDKPILLTENKSRTVAVQSSTTPFQIFATPGKTYELKVKQLGKWLPCFISVDVIKKPAP